MTPASPARLNRAMNGEQSADYVKGLSACQNVADLKALLKEYRELAIDGEHVVSQMTDADWPEFQRGLKSERRGKFAGDTWATKYAAILMPLPMIKISEIADFYKVPFGVAWARCRELCPDLLKVKVPEGSR